jgi:hypothetical protein
MVLGRSNSSRPEIGSKGHEALAFARRLAQIWSGELADTEYEENSLWAEHVAEAQKLVTNAIELGAPPPDLFYHIDGGAQIERHVPSLPLSKEQEQLAFLKRALVV